MYQWAGIGFGQQEIYRLQKSLKELAKKESASKLRFFGKIRGTWRDYYIAEGEVEGGDEGGEEGEEKPADMEPKGEGVNKFTYWVSHQSFDTWSKLPDLTPADIKAARSIKVLFTGDLDRTIYTNPFFFKKEKEYLRAQIARIVHSTTLCPVGLFKLDEDDPRKVEPVEEDEEGNVKKPTTKQMSSPSMWCHINDSILLCNRCNHMDPVAAEDQEDFDEEAEKKKMQLKDPFEPKLKVITGDKNVIISKNQKI